MRAIGFAAALLTAGCLLPGEPVEHLDLAMDLSATRVSADTGLAVTITVTNWHWQTVHLRTYGGCVAGIRLVGPEGADLPGLPFGCASILREYDLAPGASLERTFVLRFSPLRTAERWPSGEYRVVGQLLGENLEVVRETRPVAFTLVCHDPSWPAC